ncbi:MAG: DUF4476 domain-containing protein [Bacteroidota bacterium]|nr:DUF4476 domain-containing protein [Bacteroidota bacterium]MDP3145775.1 DUF4476 domain-containing protein [Bacteroidota bacterium]
MKLKFTVIIAIVAIAFNVKAQDLGKIILRNGYNSYPKFIASLNGIRLSNEYNSIATFALLDDNSYKLKLLQAGSTNLLTFTLSSEPKYLSKYLITKDNTGNYTVILESKSLMLDEPEQPATTHTFVTIPVTVSVEPAAAVTTTVLTTNPTTYTTSTITNISKAEFDERLAAVKKVSFDEKRLAKAKQVYDDEYLSTNQVIEVMKALSFDDSKLDFAKWAYKNTMDKKNYYKVDDHLTFGASKTDLNTFIKNQPK